MQEHILCITTGGSIDKTYSGEVSDFVVGAPAAKSIVRSCKVSHAVSFKEIVRKDSLQLTDEDRAALVEAVKTAREKLIVVTHGTDTMIKSAVAIRDSSCCDADKKVVVITGAFRPAAFKESDAAFNLGAAIAVLPHLPPGPHVVMNGNVFSDMSMLAKEKGSFSYPKPRDQAGQNDKHPPRSSRGRTGGGRGRSGRARKRAEPQATTTTSPVETAGGEDNKKDAAGEGGASQNPPPKAPSSTAAAAAAASPAAEAATSKEK